MIEDYECENQLSLFDIPRFKIDKPIRLIELFAGIGTQAMALRYLGADFEPYKISEWEYSAVASYKAIHFPDDHTNYSQEINDELLTLALHRLGISSDGKEPMTREQITRLGTHNKRIIYNNFKATHNVGSITNIGGVDLEIVDTDKYCYIMTYSFPCQDLSVAGKGRGMAKGSGTRSGLLWEVERLLNETENLPQVLLMENVPQVHGDKNWDSWRAWIDFLHDKGYSSYWKDLNAKEVGYPTPVPQNRDRCFMVSILGEYDYKFPRVQNYDGCINDILEEKVDEKYFVTNEKADELISKLLADGILPDRGGESS